MKITHADFTTIRLACLAVLQENGLHPIQVRTTQQAWDCFLRASSDGKLSVNELYKCYNDEHIETALRRIFFRSLR